jgi:hypothetical protein
MAKGPSTEQTAPPRRSMRSIRASQPIYDDGLDDIELIAMPEKRANKKTKMPEQPKEAIPDQSPPAPRYNTRSQQVQSSKPGDDVLSGDEEGVEELQTWPRYKDDLPNAFNGEVDPSQDFISKTPVEVMDNILEFLVLDHDPELGVKMKESNYKRRPHALVSMSAMSHLFYHAAEGFAHRFLTMNQEKLSVPSYVHWWRNNPELLQRVTANMEQNEKVREERNSRLRRSSRIANQPQEEPRKVHRMELCRALQRKCAVCLDFADTPGKFANAVSICKECEEAVNGEFVVRHSYLSAA